MEYTEGILKGEMVFAKTLGWVPSNKAARSG